MTQTNVFKCALVALLVALPMSAPGVAATAFVDANVVRTLTTSQTDANGNVMFGGCMVELDVSPSTKLNCRTDGSWVTLSCSGSYAARSDAMRMLDSAQLAFVSGRRVRVYVDDTKKLNGWCFAYRVDVISF